jgi:hypothetical protein
MTTSEVPARLLLPEGTRLVHIGPPKTGTTSVQSAFHSNRRAVAAAGVYYAGRTRHPTKPVRAVIGRSDPMTGRPGPMRLWKDLVRGIDHAKQSRAVISSEFLAHADHDAISRIVDDLGSGRTHIVVTLRPLAKILPSQWQQYVQSGSRLSLDAWLEAIFHERSGRPARGFWVRHQHDELIARWADVVGRENITVIALDDRDHDMVLRVFEQLLGLPAGILVADSSLDNRSMTLPEAETVRAFNDLFFDEGLGMPLHHVVMRFGAATYMKARLPDPGEPRILIPRWALDEAGAVAGPMVDAIVASGVRVVGDPEGLKRVPTEARPDDAEPITAIPPAIAARAAVGVLLAGSLDRSRLSRRESPNDPAADEGGRAAVMEPLDVARLPTRRLFGVIVRRGMIWARRRFAAFRGRLRRSF